MKYLVLLLLGLSSVLAFPYTKTGPTNVPGVIRGDIILTPEQNEYYFGSGKRTGLTSPDAKWTNNIVPYMFDGQNFEHELLIREALDQMEEELCLTFVLRTTEVDYVRITAEATGCWSYVGRLGGEQLMNLDPDGCYHHDVIKHEFIHAIGFFHMQSAYDRDDYVEILWENIIPGMEHNFDKVNPDTTSQFYVPYDYYSIMHYAYWAFSVNGEPTIVAHDPNVVLDFQLVMSSYDIQRINNMYCPSI